MNGIAGTLGLNSSKRIIFVDQVLVSGSNFLFTLQLAVVLGLTSYGVFASQWLWILFVMGLHQAFIQQPMFPLYFKAENSGDYVRGLGWAQLLTGILLMLFSVTILKIISLNDIFPISVWNCIQISLLLFLMSWHEFSRKYFLLRGERSKLLRIDLLVFGLQPLCLFLFPQHFTQVDHVWQFLCIVYTIAFLITSLQLLHLPISISNVRSVFRLHWNNGQFLVYTALLQWLSGNWFLVTGAALLSPGMFAIVRLSQTFAGLFTVFFQFIENAVPVEIGQALKNEQTPAGKIIFSLSKNYLPLFLTGLFLLLITIIPLGGWLFGEKAVSMPAIPFLIIGLQLFVFSGTFLRFYLRFTDKNHLLFIGYVLCTLVSIILAEPLIRVWDIYGLTIGLYIHQLIIYLPALFLLKTRRS